MKIVSHFGLIGYPLEHSFSPAYFKDKFRREGLTECSYEAFPLSSIQQLPEFLAQHTELGGFNVTIPYKEQILPYLDELDDAAAEIGAVNCVRVLRNTEKNDNSIRATVSHTGKNYRLKGYNTDAPAFAQCLREGWMLPSKALVFGTGGAAKAVAYALKRLHIDFYFVSRKKSDGQTITYAELDQRLSNNYKLWINTTPVGMFPHSEESLPLDFSVIGDEHYLFDLIYNPLETVFLRYGRERGAHTKNGLTMLYLQAELSWKLLW